MTLESAGDIDMDCPHTEIVFLGSPFMLLMWEQLLQYNHGIAIQSQVNYMTLVCMYEACC